MESERGKHEAQLAGSWGWGMGRRHLDPNGQADSHGSSGSSALPPHPMTHWPRHDGEPPLHAHWQPRALGAANSEQTMFSWA